MEYALATAAILIVAAALFGWGRSFQQLSGLPAPRWPITIGIGLGTVIFLGGVCNLFGAARPFAFNAIIVFGLGLAALPLRRSRLFSARLPQANEAWPLLLLLAMVIAIGSFLIVTTLAPATFNHHDDFEKYIPQVVRMLATGTLYDNPIGSIGIETLGGQAVLQGFILADFPLEYINGADAVFCLLLCVLITGSVAFARPMLMPAALAGSLGLIAIDPRYANIAGIYSLAAMSLALVFVGCDVVEPDRAPSRQQIEPTVGLLYAAQIAVKLTAISFVGLHFVCWIGAMAWLCGDWRLALRRGVKTALWSVIFLAPWIALWAPDYIAVLLPPHGSPALPHAPPMAPMFVSPLAADPYFHFSPAWYSAAVAIVFVVGCAALIRARLLAPGDSARERTAAFAAFCVAAVGDYVFCFVYAGPYLVGVEAGVRYATPWLIAGMAAALSLGPIFWQATPKGRDRLFAKPAAISLCIGLAFVAMFSNSLVQRVGPPAYDRMPQAYLRSVSPQVREAEARAIDEVLHGHLPAAVRDAQNQVPTGAPILAWMVAPFLLDFKRNPIREIGWYQLVRPWSLIPQTDYVLWQYNGFAVRQPRDYAAQLQGDSPLLAQASIGALKFGDLLQQIGRRSDVLYNDNGMVVLRVACPRGLALC